MEIGEKGLSVGTFTSSKQILCDLWLDQAASYFPYKQTTYIKSEKSRKHL